MPYCNWCMLESDSDDVCVWCKRPLSGTKEGYHQSRADLHYLRNSEDDVERGFPIFALIGGFAFIAVIVAAVITFKPAAKSEADGPHWSIEQQNSESPASDRWSQAPPARPIAQTSSSGTSLNVPPAPGPQPKKSLADPRLEGHSYATVDLDQFEKTSPYADNTLYFESVDMSLVKDAAGIQRLVGDVVVVNDTFGELSRGVLWLSIGPKKYQLQRFDGQVNKPLLLPDFSIASRASLTCHVIAKGLDAAKVDPGKRVLHMGAYLSGHPAQIQADMVSSSGA